MKPSVFLTRAWLWLLVALVVVSVAGCKGKRLLSKDEEIRLGRQAGDDFEREHGRDWDHRRNGILQRIGQRIENVAEPPDYPYDFSVLADDAVNAVAFPGGRIYFYRGIFNALGYDENQLAWVAGHEVTHISRQHACRRIERSLGYELVIQLIFGKDTAGEIAGVVAALVLQDYGRDKEFEADRIGLEYTQAAGYDPTAALAVLQKFSEIQGKDPSDFALLFMTHPGNTARSDAVERYLRQRGWTGRYSRP